MTLFNLKSFLCHDLCESDYTSVSVDLSFCGDPPRFVISGTLYTMYHKIGDVRDRIDEFGGIQKKTVTDYIQRLT